MAPSAIDCSVPLQHSTSDTIVTDSQANNAGHSAEIPHSPSSDTGTAESYGVLVNRKDNESFPIAIVGMSCRLPGDVSTPESLWELCSRARTGWSKIPEKRFNADAFLHPNPDKAGTFNPHGAHFLTEDLGLFDAPFFNVTEKEAISMDPQQRILLECTYEALENGGISKDLLSGLGVGVFIGGSFADYELANIRDTDTSPMFQATGCAASLMAGRLSYYFNFTGPSFVVDTACSSSLTALHTACQSMRSGEIDKAVVGGCHLNILPDYFITMSMSRLFNDTGKSYSFDHRGKSGFGRGEGAGCVFLKPLDQAIRDNDNVRAVIMATGCNQDGRTKGITVPNGDSQVALMKSVYQSAGLDTAETGFVEAHGTGTKVGDPIEARALHEVFGKHRTPRTPLLIGSVKSNVGHLEGTSGIVSVIKAALMLEKGMILPNANFEKGNENIPFSEWNLKVPTTARPWPKNKKYISINNFGFGGTNAHAVLERAPRPAGPVITGASSTTSVTQRRLYVLSGNDKQAVEKQVKSLGIYLEQRPEVFQNALLRNLAYTLGERRTLHPYKVAFTAVTSMELIPAMASNAIVPIRSTDCPKIGFVFTGQGAQWARMGHELMDAYPVFKSTMQAADHHLAKLGADFSLIEELAKDEESKVSEAHISQPACTAIQLALVDLFRTWNIRPTAVVGHSSGEIGAAYAAGVLIIEDCMAIAYYRGQSVPRLKRQFPFLRGAMMAVGSSPEDIRPLTKLLKSGRATVACINSPSSVTISGDEEAVNELQVLVETKALFNRKLRVDVAYHSHHMELVAEEYATNIKNVKPRTMSDVMFFSSLLGHELSDTLKALDASYWVQNLTKPVRFAEALTAMCQSSATGSSANNVDVLIEIGPHAALGGPCKQTLKVIGGKAVKIPYLSALLRKNDAVLTAMDTAANLLMRGVALNMKAVNFPIEEKSPTLLSDLPKYPWNHATKYWHESRISRKHCQRGSPRKDILGVLANYSNDLEPTWRNIVKIDDMPWLEHHKMQGMTVYPMAGYISMAIEAAAQRAALREVEFEQFELRELTVSRPLVITDGASIETNITLRAYTEGTRTSSDQWDEFRIFSWTKEKDWIEHCRGLIAVTSNKSNVVDGNAQVENAKQDLLTRLTSIGNSSDTPVDDTTFYKELSSKGATYGPTFQSMKKCWGSDCSALAELTIPDTAATMPMQYETDHVIHPALLDQVIQIVWPIFGAGRQALNVLYMPSFMQHMTLKKTVSKTPGDLINVWATGNPTPAMPKPTKLDMVATETVGGTEEPVITIEGFVMTPVFDGTDELASSKPRELCYKTELEPAFGAAHEHSTSSDESQDNIATHATSIELMIICDPATQQDLVAAVTEQLKDVTASILSGTIADVSPGKICVFLSELKQPMLKDISDADFQLLQKALLQSSGVIWTITSTQSSSANPESSMVVGMSRSIRSETLLKFTTLELSATSTTSEIADHIAEICKAVFIQESSSDMEFIERGGQLLVPRVKDDLAMNKFVHRETQKNVVPDIQPFKQPGRSLKIGIETAGALDTLYFADNLARDSPLPEDEVEIEIMATSMNFKDIMVSMGQLSQPYIGVECAGVITGIGAKCEGLKIGDRVTAMSEGAYATHTRCLGTSVQVIADSMSFVEAATIPVIFCTAYYGLFDLARLQKGEKVLIHAAAGGVGQAAIMLAQMVGAEVFATVGSVAKKTHIMTEYNVPEDHIFYSRNASFAKAIKHATGGRGVDVVLNSLAGDLLRETWDCLDHFGRFIEIGKRDIVGNSRLDMARFEQNAMFASVDLTVVAAERPHIMRRLLSDVFQLVNNKTVKAISPITTFSMGEVETAFRTLQGGKTMGKIVIVPKDDDQVRAVPAKFSDKLLQAKATYVLIGGTGGLGRAMARWMISKGARNLVLVSRSGSITPKVAELIREAQDHGANIFVHACDAADALQVRKLIQIGCAHLPPICGVIHGAMVLDDVLFEKMSHAQWRKVTQSKVPGAWNFHNELLSTELDFFIAISSAAGAVGNRGQAAYAAANVFLNAFCRYRNHLGLPACSIDLTAISDVGYLAEDVVKQAEVAKNLGGDTICEQEVLALIAAGITGKLNQECDGHSITGLKIGSDPSELFWSSDAKLSHLLETAQANQAAQVSTTQKVSLSTSLKSAESFGTATEVVVAGLLAKVSTVLMIEEDVMDISMPIVKYGLDSLVAIEIRNWITRELEASMQVLELLTSSSITALAKSIVVKSKLTSFTERTKPQ